MKRYRRFWQFPATVVAALGLVIGGAPPAAADDTTTSQATSATPTTSQTSEAPEPSESSTPSTTAAGDPEQSGEPGDPSPTVPNPIAGTNLSYSVKVLSDGTMDFDNDDSAGNDSSPKNGIVRVNDTVTYRLNFAVNEGQGTNSTFTLSLPKGMEFDSLPSVCLSGNISPSSAGEPSLPLSASSVDELKEQTLTCNVGTLSADSKVIDITARVLGYVHNGTELKPTRATLKIDESPEYVVPESELPEVTASARLKWDISMNSIALEEDKGYFYGPATEPCPWDKARVCKRSGLNLLISAPTSGKGAMPAIGDFTATADLSFETMYPQLSSAQLEKANGDKDKYGSRIVYDGGYYSAPGPKIGGVFYGVTATPTNSVRDSGVITFDKDKLAEPVEFRVSGADMSLRTYPSHALRPDNTPIPGNRAYAVSHYFSVYTPVDTIKEFGVEKDGVRTLHTTYRYTKLDMNGFTSNDHLNLAGQDAFNDYRTATPNITTKGSLNKAFTGVPGAERNMAPVEFSPGYASRGEGPPGGATIRSGGITVAPSQEVLSQLLVVGSRSEDPIDKTVVLCDSWDNSRLHLHAKDVPASAYPGTTFQSIPSNGAPVWVSGYNNVKSGDGTRWATSAAEAPQLTVQYSAKPGGAEAASQCGDDNGPWFDDPAAVPGNDAALLAKGIYTGVGRVRVHAVLPGPVANTVSAGSGVTMVLSINHRVSETNNNVGDIVPNWAAMKAIDAVIPDVNAALQDPTAWSNSGYVPDKHQGAPGDRLIVALAQARVDKKVRRGTDGEFTDTPPQVNGGGTVDSATGQVVPADTVQFRLTPSLTSGALTTGILKEYWVEDCVPTSLDYESAEPRPAIVQKVTKKDGSDTEVVLPDGAKITGCKADETYIRWVYPQQEVNGPMEPIILTTRVSPLAQAGVYKNTVLVWAEGDQSDVKQRLDSAEVQINNLGGIKLDKVALTPEVQVNRTGQQNHELNKWQVSLVNTVPPGDDAPVENPDIIDVLPKNGEADSNFNGSLSFVSAKVVNGGDKVRIQYTKDPNVKLDPRDQGSTVWCDAPTSNDEGCPKELAEVTGLRIQRPGKFVSSDKITVEVAMKGEGNAKGDVYVNRAFAVAQGLQFPVGPIARPERVVESSIGDYTWWDTNRNGIQDEFGGAPEKPAPGVTVKLEGTDDLGNKVALETTTNDAGRYLFSTLRASDAKGYKITFTGKGKLTTKQAPGSNVDNDSNANPDTGESDPVVLPPNTENLSVDAGFTATGSLVFTKLLKGQGVDKYAPGDELEFDVRCVLDGKEVLQKTLTMTVPKGKTEITADPIKDIPAGAVCTVTETKGGNSDPGTPPSTSVEIGFDSETGTGNEEQIALTNNYSAGVIRIAKKLTGEPQAVEDAKTRNFVFDVTCKLAEDQPPVLHVQGITVTGENSVEVKGEDGNPAKLPKSAKCWVEETDAAGAIATTIDHHDFASGALIDPANPDELAEITITATNTVEIPRVPFKVSKVLVANGSTGSDEFGINYQCSAPGRDAAGAEVPAEGSVQVTAGTDALVGDFPVGTECELTAEAHQERKGYTLNIDLGDKAQVAAPGLTLVATNTYVRDLGGFEVTKIVGGDDADAAKDKKFLIDYECFDPIVGGGSKSGSIPVSVAGGPARVTGIPTGWECSLSEDEKSAERPNYTSTKREVKPSRFVVPDKPAAPDTENPVLVTVTNEYSRDHGSFAVTKKVTGDDADTFRDRVFKVNYTCGEQSGVVEVKGDGVVVPGPRVPTGTKCVLSEDLASATPDNYAVAPLVTPAEFVVSEKDSVTAVQVTNEFKRDKGGLALTKQVTGDAASIAPKEFTFEYTCTGLPAGETRQAKVTPGKVTQITDLPTGKCTITELAADVAQTDRVTRLSVNGGTAVDGNSVEVDVEKQQTVSVHAENVYTAHRAKFEISKVVNADVDPAGIIADNVYEFTYKCENRGTFEGSLFVRADGKPVASPELPTGSKCTVAEVASSAAHSGFDVVTPKPFEFTLGEKDSVHKIEAVNNYTRHRGTFSLAKVVKSVVQTGGGSYTFSYECTDGTKGDLVVPGDGKAVASNANIQVGASCRVWEDVEKAQRPGLLLRPAGDMAFTIDSKGQNVELTAVNTYTPPVIPFIPLIPIVPPLNPVVPGSTPPPASGNVLTQIVEKGGQLAKTGVSGMVLPLAGLALILIAGGVVLVRRKKD